MKKLILLIREIGKFRGKVQSIKIKLGSNEIAIEDIPGWVLLCCPPLYAIIYKWLNA